MDRWENWLFALGGGAIGSIVATAGAYLLYRTRRGHEAAERQAEQERENLIRVQEAIFDHHDALLEAVRRGREGAPVDEEKVQRREARVRVLAGRVREDELRNHLYEYLETVLGLATVPDWFEETLDDVFIEVSGMYLTLADEIEKRLRRP